MSSIRHIARPEPARSADDAYLDAARDAVLAVGWSRTTLTGIARRAGVSRMTLYRRWPDTRALLGDLMAREWRALMTRALQEATDGSTGVGTGTAAEQVADVAVACVAALRDDPLLRRVVEVDPDVLLPYLLQRSGRTQRLAAQTLGDLVEAGQATGEVRPGDPRRLAGALLLAVQGFVLSVDTVAADAGTPADTAVAAYDAELRLLVARYLAP